MIPKINRADKKTLDLVFRFGRFLNSQHLTLKFLLNEQNILKNKNYPRISFIVPKNISKLAVKRNKLRRIGYSVLRDYIKSAPDNLTGAFLYKKYTKDIEIVKNEVKEILNKIN
jgi:ribonuclease P protein component